MLNPSGHTVYKIMYKFETRTVPIWRHYSHHFFDILLTFLIDLLLDTFSNILNRIQVQTIARPFQYGYMFIPEPLFVRFAACFRSFHQIYAIHFSYICLITQCRTIPSNHFLFWFINTQFLSFSDKFSKVPVVGGIKNSGLSAPFLYYIPSPTMMNSSTLYQIEREISKDCDNNWQTLYPSVNASKMSFLLGF